MAEHAYLRLVDPVEKVEKVENRSPSTWGWRLRCAVAAWLMHRALGANGLPALQGPGRRVLVREPDGRWSMLSW